MAKIDSRILAHLKEACMLVVELTDTAEQE